MASLPELTDEAFNSEIAGSSLPVLVDFGAEWCHPCKQLDPIVEELADEWEGKVRVFHLDIDENTDSTMEYGVMGVPTLILFKQGEPVERMTGYAPRKKLIETLGPHLDL